MLSLCDLGLDSGFLDVILKAQSAKEQVDKLDCLKIKNLCSKGYYQESEKVNFQNGKKVFAYQISEMGLVSRMYKELLPLYNKKTTQL